MSGASQDWTPQYNGNIAGQKVSVAGTDSTFYNYLYDQSDRLQQENRKSSGQANFYIYENFVYDQNGNQLGSSLNLEGSADAYYTGTNQLRVHYRLNVTDTLYKFVYDGNGNIVYDSVSKVSYQYDLYNQLNTVIFHKTQWDDSLTFGYNTGGERVYKKFVYHYKDSCGGGIGQDGMEMGEMQMDIGDPPPRDTLCWFREETETRYIWGQGKILAEYWRSSSEGGWWLRKYIYAGGQRIAMIDRDDEIYYYISDHLGSTRVVIRASDSTVVDKYNRYLAFGADDGSVVSLNQSYRYTGKPLDSEGGIDMYYYGARYYNPRLPRFTQIDPLRNKYPSWSPYVYALDNPLKNVDPDGQAGIDLNSTVKEMRDKLVNGVNRAIDKVLSTISVAVSVGPQAGAKFGDVGSRIGLTVDAMYKLSEGSTDLSTNFEASAKVGDVKANATLRSDLLTGSNSSFTVGVSNSSSELSATVTHNDQTGSISSKLTGNIGTGPANMTTSGQLELSLGACLVGATVIIDPNAKGTVGNTELTTSINSMKDLVKSIL